MSNGTAHFNPLPLFKGENYSLWSLKMRTLLQSQDLWDLVEKGYEASRSSSSTDVAALKDIKKRDAKALYFIQSSLDEDVLVRISHANTSHEAWTFLKQEFLGDQKVIKVRLMSLKNTFSDLKMDDKESLQSYLSKSQL